MIQYSERQLSVLYAQSMRAFADKLELEAGRDVLSDRQAATLRSEAAAARTSAMRATAAWRPGRSARQQPARAVS